MADAIKEIQPGPGPGPEPIYTPPQWGTGSDAEIIEAIEKDIAGEIDLYDYWAIGDERIVSLSSIGGTNVGETHIAQNVVLVLMDSTCTGFEYVMPLSNGRTTPKFIVGMKGILNNGTSREGGYMNSTDTNNNGWEGSARRTWCNEDFYQSIRSLDQQLPCWEGEYLWGSE